MFRREDRFRRKEERKKERKKEIYGSSGERRNIFVITVIRDRVRGEKLPGGRKGRKNWWQKVIVISGWSPVVASMPRHRVGPSFDLSSATGKRLQLMIS